MLLDFARLGALRTVLAAIGILVGIFLLLPIVLIVALSFGSSQWLQFPPPAWTLEMRSPKLLATTATPSASSGSTDQLLSASRSPSSRYCAPQSMA